jgi:hypothetical protein
MGSDQVKDQANMPNDIFVYIVRVIVVRGVKICAF